VGGMRMGGYRAAVGPRRELSPSALTCEDEAACHIVLELVRGEQHSRQGSLLLGQ
jgi:hypothetical protein